MQVQLAYGKRGLDVDLPAGVRLVEPQFVAGVSDEPAAIRQALHEPIGAPPLRDSVGPGDTVAIVHTDITRATPNHRILPVLLAELEAAGVDEDPVTGSASGGMACYLAHYGLTDKRQMVFEQGHVLGRPGRVYAWLDEEDGEITRVRIGGAAVTVMDGTLRLDL